MILVRAPSIRRSSWFTLATTSMSRLACESVPELRAPFHAATAKWSFYRLGATAGKPCPPWSSHLHGIAGASWWVGDRAVSPGRWFAGLPVMLLLSRLPWPSPAFGTLGPPPFFSFFLSCRTAFVRAKLSSSIWRPTTGRFHNTSFDEIHSAVHIPKSKHIATFVVKFAAHPGKFFLLNFTHLRESNSIRELWQPDRFRIHT